jgi:hypothetical protein
MISENVIPITSFGNVGIPKDYDVQEWSACTNGIINAVNGTTKAFATTYLLYDNVNSSIIKSNNISTVTLDTAGYWTLEFDTEYDRDYVPFVNAYRSTEGEFPVRSDLLFAGYRGASTSSIQILVSWTDPNSFPYGWGNSDDTNYNAAKTISGISGADGGFEYFSVVIF